MGIVVGLVSFLVAMAGLYLLMLHPVAPRKCPRLPQFRLWLGMGMLCGGCSVIVLLIFQTVP